MTQTRPNGLRIVTPPVFARPHRVAVLANANAKQMTPKMQALLAEAAGRDAVHLSRSQLDARRIARDVLESGADELLLAGGDGTIAGFLTELAAERRRIGLAALPPIGILKLGTGNAVANWTNSSRPHAIGEDIMRLRAGHPFSRRSMGLLKAGGKLVPFAGFGIDGRVINDYSAVRDAVGKGILKPLFAGPGGYAAAALFRTIPHYLTKPLSGQVRVTAKSRGEERRLDGSVIRCFSPGEVLYTGSAMMVAASTQPLYGYGIRMFPHAGQRPDQFQLRICSRTNPIEVLANFPRLCAGKWVMDGVYDYIGSDFDVEFDKAMPLQVAGDAAGFHTSMRFALSGETVELIDFGV